MKTDLPAKLREEIARRSLVIVADQQARVFVSVLILDGFLVWLLSRAGLLLPALAWAGANLVLLLVRDQVLKRHSRGGAAAMATVGRLVKIVAIQGWIRAAIMPPLFVSPVIDTHYVFTMVIIGQVAGAVGSIGGQLRAYLMWAVPVTGVLAISWMAQRSFEGVWIGALLLMLLHVLVKYVSGSAATLEQLVRSADEQERLAMSLREERDRVQQASETSRMLAESLRVERDRAEAASQAKTRFFAAASHDLRQPLHALSINATTLGILSRRQHDATIQELSDSINRALQQSNSLLDSLLDISRLDAGSVQLDVERFDVNGLLSAVVNEFRPSALQKGLTLDRDGEAGVGESAREAWVETDFDTLLRIVNNLVSNALKFTVAGGVVVSARIETGTFATHRHDVVIRVRDTGIGIAKEELDRVFEEFYQIGNPARDRDRGLGLGLSIVQRSAALLGARLGLSSVPGEGTTVEVRFPASEAPTVSKDPITNDQNELEGDEISLVGRGALVIDDEPEITRSLGNLLLLCGCEVRTAASLNEGLAALDSGFEPEVLIIDHRLRDETGVDVLSEFRRRLPDVAAIIVTGDTSPQNLNTLANAGCRVMHKPIDGLKLVRAVQLTLSESAVG